MLYCSIPFIYVFILIVLPFSLTSPCYNTPIASTSFIWLVFHYSILVFLLYSFKIFPSSTWFSCYVEHTHTHTHTHINIPALVHTHAHAHICKNSHTQINMHSQVHIHAHEHAWTCVHRQTHI